MYISASLLTWLKWSYFHWWQTTPHHPLIKDSSGQLEGRLWSDEGERQWMQFGWKPKLVTAIHAKVDIYSGRRSLKLTRIRHLASTEYYHSLAHRIIQHSSKVAITYCIIVNWSWSQQFSPGVGQHGHFSCSQAGCHSNTGRQHLYTALQVEAHTHRGYQWTNVQSQLQGN